MGQEIKRIPIKELRELGFLQEANRQFFHPHGLALEVTICTDSDEVPPPVYAVALPAARYERMLLLARVANDDDLVERLEQAERYDVGDAYLSGVWDYRDDPDGIVFGNGGYGDSRERAETVLAERMRHAQHRYRLFHGDGVVEIDDQEDVEPLDWTYPGQ